MDDFSQSSNIDKKQEKELTEIFRVLELPQVDRSTVLNLVALSMVEAWEKNKEFDLSAVTSRFSSSEGDNKGKAGLPAAIASFRKSQGKQKTSFTMPRTTNFLSSTVTATKATSEMYRFEAAMTYIVLAQFRTLVLEALKKEKDSRKSTATRVVVVGVVSVVVSLGLLAAFGPAAAAGAPAMQAFLETTAVGTMAVWGTGIGCTLALGGAVGYLVAALSGGRAGVHSSSLIAEKFVLSTVCGPHTCGADGNSLQSHEEGLLETIGFHMSDDQWKGAVGSDALKELSRQNRTEIISFVRRYVEPIRSLRSHLARKRVFTIAVIGEPGSGKTTFVSNAYRQRYHERTTDQQTYVAQVPALDGTVIFVNVLDFPGMNGNDTFAGADVSNLIAMLPAIDCLLFFTKLNSRCFLANELLDQVRGTCKIRMVLSHVDTVLRNKFYTVEGHDSDDDDDSDAPMLFGHEGEEKDANTMAERAMLVNMCMDSLVTDKKSFCSEHCIPTTDAVFWVPNRALQDLQPLYRNALSPHLESTNELADWLATLVY